MTSTFSPSPVFGRGELSRLAGMRGRRLVGSSPARAGDPFILARLWKKKPRNDDTGTVAGDLTPPAPLPSQGRGEGSSSPPSPFRGGGRGGGVRAPGHRVILKVPSPRFRYSEEAPPTPDCSGQFGGFGDAGE